MRHLMRGRGRGVAVLARAAASTIPLTSSAKSSAAAAGDTIFENMSGGQQADPSQPQRGDDLRYDLEISLEEAALGCDEGDFRHQG